MNTSLINTETITAQLPSLQFLPTQLTTWKSPFMYCFLWFQQIHGSVSLVTPPLHSL